MNQAAVTAPDDTGVETLSAQVRGRVIGPADADYDAARAVWNWSVDRRPAVIVRCAGAADVIRALAFARDHGLQVAVRGAGHNVTGSAVCDAGLVVDLSAMKGIRVDPAARTVRVEPGLTWAEVTRELEPFGLAAAGGYVSSTGVGGLTLGGGLGWLVRKHGLACDNLVSADVVTADGRYLRTSSNEHADLFWALRGGGGNFGVVTSFEFRVHPLGAVLAGLVIHPASRAREVLRFFRELTAEAPDELTCGAILFHAPPAPFIPAEAHGAPVIAVGGVYAGPPEEGEKAVAALRAFGPPVADIFQRMPFSAAQTMADPLWPRGHQYWKSSFLTGLPDDAIEVVVEHFASIPSPMTPVLVDHNGGGAIARVPAEETAFGHRGWTFNFLISSIWSDAADGARNVDWTRRFTTAMQPHAANAQYVNYVGAEGDERPAELFGASYARLVGVKDRYDPDNVFSLYHNIPPSAGVQ
jgi:FAD/FMN-containing dehydrogenase